jgi:cobalt/nickel transport system ATP-binding protein
MGLGSEEASARAKVALERVGMGGLTMKAPYHLSAGEKRRVAIAGVLAMDPEILILDEPTTYLDPPAERDLAVLLRNLPQAKIVITHDIAFARALASRAVFFERGRIVAAGSVDELVTRYNWEPHL